MVFLFALLYGYGSARMLRDLGVPFSNVLTVFVGLVVFHNLSWVYYSRAVTDEIALLGLLLGVFLTLNPRSAEPQ
jgi:hypothetical protein